jgi:hypothetical protein
VDDRALAPQMAVERAKAGGLALERCGGQRRPFGRPASERGEETGQLDVSGPQHVAPVRLHVGAELQQIGTVGLQRVAR